VIAVGINVLLDERGMTKYRLAKESNLPHTTILDICSGKTELPKCNAETVYKVAKALDTTVEALIAPALEQRPNFEWFKSQICHDIKRMGDIDFLIQTLESGEIKHLYEKKWYLESFYLLALVDYLSRINDLPLVSNYNDIRSAKMETPVYPAGVLVRSIFSGNDFAKEESKKNAIPEFLRHNIIEAEVRDVC